MSRWNPFSRLPNPREVFSWGLYDVANQSFQLIINTLLFGMFLQAVVVEDPDRGKKVWSMFIAVGLLLVVVLSPIIGALADRRAWKREILLTVGVVASLCTGALALLGPGDVALAAAIYITAAVACGLGENFLGSFLPEISTPRNVGFVSALGWTMSYAGALVLLGVTALYAFVFDRNEPSEFRPMFVLSGVWFFLGILPTAFWLREKARPPAAAKREFWLTAGFSQLAHSAREARRYRQVVRFLSIFFVYSMGTQTIVYFLGVIGDDMGFGLKELVLFSLLTAVTAGAASSLIARVQDRFGHKRTVMVSCAVWALTTAILAAAQVLEPPAWLFWAFAALIGLGFGGIGTSSRALVGAFTPPDRGGEFFGLWGASYKLAGIAGALLFGVVSTSLADKDESRALALAMVTLFFALGVLLLWLFVNEKEGVRAAEHTDPAALAE